MRVASIKPALGFSLRPKPGRSRVLTSRYPLVGMGSLVNLHLISKTFGKRLSGNLQVAEDGQNRLAVW